MTPPEFEGLLSRAIGLDAASVSPAAIERAVRLRLQECGLSLDAYWEKVQGPGDELRQLIEAVVVPETWFFRDREAFAVLGRHVAEEVRRPDGATRLLSFPCSTGEEPYSMAMTLLDAGISPERFRIDGFDISRRALALAAGAVYGRNSFRGADLDFRDRHFAPEGRDWRLGAAARGTVRFREANLLDAAPPSDGGAYDAVFCRNVLIYFDRTAQERALEILTRLLSPDGLLFVGPSETSLAMERGFAPIGVPHSFAFRKETSGKRKALVAARTAPVLPAWAPPPTPPRAAPRAAAFAAPAPVAPVPVPDTGEDALAAARLLADQGRLADAALRCEAHLRERGPSAEGYYLLGVVRDAQGNRADAAALYRRALYLDPAHGEVMAHLATLLEHQGDAGTAQALNERARRLAGKKGA